MTVALLVVSLLAIVEGFIIFGLLNRLLIQAQIKPLGLPKMAERQREEEPEPPRRRPQFSVPIES